MVRQKNKKLPVFCRSLTLWLVFPCALILQCCGRICIVNIFQHDCITTKRDQHPCTDLQKQRTQKLARRETTAILINKNWLANRYYQAEGWMRAIAMQTEEGWLGILEGEDDDMIQVWLLAARENQIQLPLPVLLPVSIKNQICHAESTRGK